MRAKSKLAISLTLITVSAAAVAYYTALPGFNLSHVASVGADESLWETAFIRSHVPVGLVQPEWLRSGPNLFFRWMIAESLARLGVVCALWIGSIVFAVSRYMKRPGNPTAQPAHAVDGGPVGD